MWFICSGLALPGTGWWAVRRSSAVVILGAGLFGFAVGGYVAALMRAAARREERVR